MGEANRISIIVPCRNERRAIGAFLDSLGRQELGPYEWEVIVADGMSDDGTREILQAFAAQHNWFRVIDNPQKVTPTGLNAAIRAASANIIARMDVHTQYAPDYVRKCADTLVTTGAGNVGGPARTRAEGILARAIAAAYHSPFACGGAKFHDDTYEGPADTVPYGCWFRETLDRVGLFDPEMVRNQDDELNLRLIRQGGTIWQSPAIQSWYSPRATLRALFKQYYQYGFWKIPIILKYRLPASPRHLVPGLFVLVNLLLLLGLTAGFGTGSARLFWPSAVLIALVLGSYLAAVTMCSLLTARKAGWTLAPHLPAIFATYHVSYGLGFLSGIAYFSARRWWPVRLSKAFTELSR